MSLTKFTWTFKSATSTQEGSLSASSATLYPTLLTISWAWWKEHFNHRLIAELSHTREVHSTESFLDSWLRAVTLLTEMERVVNQSGDHTSMMRISIFTTLNHICSQWQTLVQTQTDHNSSSRSKQHHILMVIMSSSVRFSKDLKLYRSCRESDHLTALHLREQSSGIVASSKVINHKEKVKGSSVTFYCDLLINGQLIDI